VHVRLSPTRRSSDLAVETMDIEDGGLFAGHSGSLADKDSKGYKARAARCKLQRVCQAPHPGYASKLEPISRTASRTDTDKAYPRWRGCRRSPPAPAPPR